MGLTTRRRPRPGDQCASRDRRPLPRARMTLLDAAQSSVLRCALIAAEHVDSLSTAALASPPRFSPCDRCVTGSPLADKAYLIRRGGGGVGGGAGARSSATW